MRNGNTIYFLYAPGCEGCKASKPHVLTFAKTGEAKVVPVDLTETDWRGAWEPTTTPTFVLVESKRRTFHVLEGQINSPKELSAWIAGVTR